MTNLTYSVNNSLDSQTYGRKSYRHGVVNSKQLFDNMNQMDASHHLASNTSAVIDLEKFTSSKLSSVDTGSKKAAAKNRRKPVAKSNTGRRKPTKRKDANPGKIRQTAVKMQPTERLTSNFSSDLISPRNFDEKSPLKLGMQLNRPSRLNLLSQCTPGASTASYCSNVANTFTYRAADNTPVNNFVYQFTPPQSPQFSNHKPAPGPMDKQHMAQSYQNKEIYRNNQNNWNNSINNATPISNYHQVNNFHSAKSPSEPLPNSPPNSLSNGVAPLPNGPKVFFVDSAAFPTPSPTPTSSNTILIPSHVVPTPSTPRSNGSTIISTGPAIIRRQVAPGQDRRQVVAGPISVSRYSRRYREFVKVLPHNSGERVKVEMLDHDYDVPKIDINGIDKIENINNGGSNLFPESGALASRVKQECSMDDYRAETSGDFGSGKSYSTTRKNTDSLLITAAVSSVQGMDYTSQKRPSNTGSEADEYYALIVSTVSTNIALEQKLENLKRLTHETLASASLQNGHSDGTAWNTKQLDWLLDHNSTTIEPSTVPDDLQNIDVSAFKSLSPHIDWPAVYPSETNANS